MIKRLSQSMGAAGSVTCLCKIEGEIKRFYMKNKILVAYKPDYKLVLLYSPWALALSSSFVTEKLFAGTWVLP